MKTVEQLERELEHAEAVLGAATPTFDGDPATARLGPVALRQHHARTDAQLARYSNALAAVRAARDRLSAARACQAEAQRPKLTAADLVGASAVRDRHGWHQVVRVNRTTVTVETGYSWTARIPAGKVLEVRR